MHTSRHRGFTLIEVLIALSIVGLALAAVGTTVLQMINQSTTMRDRTYASWIAQNRITEIRISTDKAEPGVSNGDVEYANTEWSWRAEILETGVPDLYRIDVEVTFADSDDVIRKVSGFVGDPPVANIASRAFSKNAGRRGPES